MKQQKSRCCFTVADRTILKFGRACTDIDDSSIKIEKVNKGEWNIWA
jgi:hypothetical protein